MRLDKVFLNMRIGTVRDYYIAYNLKESNFKTGELVPVK